MWEESITIREIQNLILEEIDNLPPRSSEILRMRFGVNRKRMTCNQISAEFHVSRQRVDQIEKKAKTRIMTKILDRLTKDCPWEYFDQKNNINKE